MIATKLDYPQRKIQNKDANAIDHFHKWWPIVNYFAKKFSLTNVTLKLVIQNDFYSETRLVRLI